MVGFSAFEVLVSIVEGRNVWTSELVWERMEGQISVEVLILRHVTACFLLPQSLYLEQPSSNR